MIALDTNILVRYFTRDDERQTRLASQVIENLSLEDPAYLSLVVLVELSWVLESRYQFSSLEIARVLFLLLTTEGFVIERASSAHEAYEALRDSRATFGDALIATISVKEGCTTTYTFDRKASRLPGFTLLS